MRKTIFKILVFLLVLLPELAFAKDIKVSDKLKLVQLSPNVYMHTCEGNNGLVYINQDKALLVSTPDSDEETQHLIDWVQLTHQAKIVAYVIDRWHPDAMEGLDVVHRNKIPSYAYQLTQEIAAAKQLPIPQNIFNTKLELEVNDKKVICHFLGAAHTTDGIVVYIPSEKILFGGNGIRNFKGWVGNIGDAKLEEWSATARRIKEQYGSARFVIPGHGKHGGPELIDYTIELYNNIAPLKHIKLEKKILSQLQNNPQHFFNIRADSSYLSKDNTMFTNAISIAQDKDKFVRIQADFIRLDSKKQMLKSDKGSLQIYDKLENGYQLRSNVNYKNLIVLFKNDEVGLRIILKEFSE